MVCVTGVAVLPHKSVAVNVRTKLEAAVQVWTLHADEPEPESVNETVTRVQPFWVAVAVPVDEGSVDPPQGTVTVAGAFKTGATLESITRMVWLLEVPAPVQVRVMMVMVPSTAQFPAEVESVKLTLPVVPHEPAVTVAVPVTLGSVEDVQGTVVSAGIWRVPPTVVAAKLTPVTPPEGTLTERGLELDAPAHKPNEEGTETE